MRFFILAVSCFALAVVAQNADCGPEYENQICDAGECCSGAGGEEEECCSGAEREEEPEQTEDSTDDIEVPQCDTSDSESTCEPQPPPLSSTVPEIDVCGDAEGGVSCPGAGADGYYYRCCSSIGHCGPKNPIQDQNVYCGEGCQAGYGECQTRAIPAALPAPHAIAEEGNACGAIPNARCADDLCCSGSNFCGTGPEFCGAANWCQPEWGACDSTVRVRVA